MELSLMREREREMRGEEWGRWRGIDLWWGSRDGRCGRRRRSKPLLGRRRRPLGPWREGGGREDSDRPPMAGSLGNGWSPLWAPQMGPTKPKKKKPSNWLALVENSSPKAQPRRNLLQFFTYNTSSIWINVIKWQETSFHKLVNSKIFGKFKEVPFQVKN